MLVPLPPFRLNGYVLCTEHRSDDGGRTVTTEWSGGRVIRIDARLVPPLPFDPVGSHVIVGGLRLRVLWRHFEMNAYDCVPDDGRARVEVAITRLCEALSAVEMAVARFCWRRGWVYTKPGSAFQWRETLPLTLARWR